jgi:uncharacterized protein YeaO (DUF488 family)
MGDRGFELQRVYDRTPIGPGRRVLVDRLWPRGVRKAELRLDEWAKDVAPSTELRRWYDHDPRKFEPFAARYRAELAAPPAADVVAALRAASSGERVVLLTATRDLDHSGAKVLLEHLDDVRS